MLTSGTSHQPSLLARVHILRAWWMRWRGLYGALPPGSDYSDPPPHQLTGYVSVTTDVVAGRTVWTMCPVTRQPPSLTWLSGVMHEPAVPGLPLPRVLNAEPAAVAGAHVMLLHGGAYAAGTRAGVWELARSIVDATGATVWVPDYPLVPSSTAMATTSWTLDLYAQVVRHVEPSRLLVLGDSAGGGLALATVMAARDTGLPLPSRVVTWAPWLDVSLTHPDIARVEDPMLDSVELRRLGALYAGDLPLTDPRVSPAHGSLEGLPPVEVHCGTQDIMLPDAHALGRRRGATFTLYPGALHGWWCSRRLPESQRVRAALFDRVRRLTDPPHDMMTP